MSMIPLLLARSLNPLPTSLRIRRRPLPLAGRLLRARLPPLPPPPQPPRQTASPAPSQNLTGYIPSELGSLLFLRRLNLHGKPPLRLHPRIRRTSLSRDGLGATTSDTGAHRAASVSGPARARNATRSIELSIPTNLSALGSSCCCRRLHTGIDPSAHPMTARIADSTVSVSVNSFSSGFATVRSPNTIAIAAAATGVIRGSEMEEEEAGYGLRSAGSDGGNGEITS